MFIFCVICLGDRCHLCSHLWDPRLQPVGCWPRGLHQPHSLHIRGFPWGGGGGGFERCPEGFYPHRHEQTLRWVQSPERTQLSAMWKLFNMQFFRGTPTDWSAGRLSLHPCPKCQHGRLCPLCQRVWTNTGRGVTCSWSEKFIYLLTNLIHYWPFYFSFSFICREIYRAPVRTLGDICHLHSHKMLLCYLAVLSAFFTQAQVEYLSLYVYRHAN